MVEGYLLLIIHKDIRTERLNKGRPHIDKKWRIINTEIDV